METIHSAPACNQASSRRVVSFRVRGAGFGFGIHGIAFGVEGRDLKISELGGRVAGFGLQVQEKHPRPETYNPKLATRSPNPEIVNPQPSALNAMP